VKLFKLQRSREIRNIEQEGAEKKEEEKTTNTSASQLGKRIEAVISLKVISGILFLVFLFPLLGTSCNDTAIENQVY
jgi:hypothetical protein